MRILYRHIAIGLLLISAVSMATFEFFLEHHRPVQSQGMCSTPSKMKAAAMTLDYSGVQ